MICTPTSFFLVLYGGGIFGIGLSAVIFPGVVPMDRGLIALAVGLLMSIVGWWMIRAKYRAIHFPSDTTEEEGV